MQLFISFIVIIILFLHATVISSESMLLNSFNNVFKISEFQFLVICDSGKTCHNNGVCNVEFIDDVSTSWCRYAAFLNPLDYFNPPLLSCRSNFDGPLCQYRKCPMDNICKNGGICESFGRSIRCHCPIYFGGDFCQDRLPTACDVTDCGNGRCVLLANSLDLAMCECDEGFSGQFCSVVDACKLDSCSFRGECIANGAKDFACICERGFTGKSCEIDIDECQTHACHPGSKCIDKVGEYECECAPGRVGNYCQFEDPCLKADFCKGNGQCFATIRGEPTCLCNDGFTVSLHEHIRSNLI